MNRSLRYAADFETTTDVNDCRVWAWAVCNVEDLEIEYGTSIDGFLDWCSNPKHNYTCYFHNLRFDGEFIISALGRAGYTHIEDSKDKADYTYSTIISGMGEFYQIEVYFHVGKNRVNKVTFLDSLKIFPNFSVDRIAKSFGLPISKLKIDYNKPRPIGYQLDQQEINYVKNDVEIVARALAKMFDNGFTKMTMASNALNNFKEHFPNFRNYFPELPKEIDQEVRAAYRGGFTCVSPKYKEKEVGRGLCLDVNSLYPSILYYEDLPYGHGVRFEGEYEYDPTYPLYVQTFTCKFKLKPEKIATIQIRNNYSFMPNEYVESSNDEYITLTLTNPDFELFKEHYYTYEIKYEGGIKFMAKKGLFKNYIDYWMEQKIKAQQEGNPGQRAIAKLAMNSIYGKFAASPHGVIKIPFVDENGNVKYITKQEEKDRKTIYIPVAAWTTAYGHVKIVGAAQKIREWGMKVKGYDPWVYTDTDSLKLLVEPEDLEEIGKFIEIDDYKLGAFAMEEVFTKMKAIRQKCYICMVDGMVESTISGLPKNLAPIINFENFHRGFTTAGMTYEDLVELAKKNNATEEELEKLQFKNTYVHCDGGVVFARTDFTIT